MSYVMLGAAKNLRGVGGDGDPLPTMLRTAPE
jgi:hypothetical protein